MSGVRAVGEILERELPAGRTKKAKRVLASYNCAVDEIKQTDPNCIMVRLELSDLFEIMKL